MQRRESMTSQYGTNGISQSKAQPFMSPRAMQVLKPKTFSFTLLIGALELAREEFKTHELLSASRQGLHGAGHAAAALRVMHENSATVAVCSAESAHLRKLQSCLLLHGLTAGSQQVQVSAQLAHQRH